MNFTVKSNPTYQKPQEKIQTHDYIPQVIMQEGSQKHSDRSHRSIGANNSSFKLKQSHFDIACDIFQRT